MKHLRIFLNKPFTKWARIYHNDYMCNHNIHNCKQKRYHNALTNNLDTFI